MNDRNSVASAAFGTASNRFEGRAALHCSIIISVLESYEVVRRQCLHLQGIVPADWEVILLDDGSDPPLAFPETCSPLFSLIYTRSTRTWTQPEARNLGARISRGRYLFFTDIDHIISNEAVDAVKHFSGARMLFPRSLAVLDETGQTTRDLNALRAAGWAGTAGDPSEPADRIHQNTFAIRREIFLDRLRGYDERLCADGEYGGDDVDLNQRYTRLIEEGAAEPDALGPTIHVFPDPAKCDLFHGLPRTPRSTDLPDR